MAKLYRMMFRNSRAFWILVVLIILTLMSLRNRSLNHHREIDYLRGLNLDSFEEFKTPQEGAPDKVDVLVKMRDMSRLYKTLFERLYLTDSVDHDIRSKSYLRAQQVLKALEKILYPINRITVPGGLKQIYDSYVGRGIVMSSGAKHFKYTLHAIQVIRYLNCTLPIEVFYFGNQDLPIKMRDVLSKLQNVRVIDMKPFLRKNGPDVGGWSTKPLAMLFSQFQEVIFMDSDTLFFHDPEEMFSWYRYVETGTLYFRDRTVGNDNLIKFLKTMAPEPSEMAKQGRVWQRIAGQEGESGVIVIDKRRGGFFTLLMASLLNMEPFENIRTEIFVGGDKETFWVSNEALNLPYSWGTGAGGSIGYRFSGDKDAVCGGLYHTDENWNPSWFNGGIVKYKWTEKPETYSFTHLAVDRNSKPIKWFAEAASLINCLHPENPNTDLMEIPQKAKTIIDEMFRLWYALPEPEHFL